MSSPCAVWDFRISAEGLSKDTIISALTHVAKSYAFQLERGDSGYLHYQGRISLTKKRRASEKHILLALLQSMNFNPNYLEPTVKDVALAGEMFYVMKQDTRVDGPWTDKDAERDIYIPRQYRDIEDLLPFQQTIRNQITDDKSFNSRFINFVYCRDGNKGKSTISHLMRLRHGAICVPAIINDAKELVQMLCDVCMDSKIRSPPAVFIDMPRAINKERLYGLYSAIEVIKDGYLYDCRHHFKYWDIDSPHVWVFSNSFPDTSMLSEDRWNIWTIDENYALVEYCKGCDEETCYCNSSHFSGAHRGFLKTTTSEEGKIK